MPCLFFVAVLCCRSAVLLFTKIRQRRTLGRAWLMHARQTISAKTGESREAPRPGKTRSLCPGGRSAQRRQLSGGEVVAVGGLACARARVCVRGNLVFLHWSRLSFGPLFCAVYTWLSSRLACQVCGRHVGRSGGSGGAAGALFVCSMASRRKAFHISFVSEREIERERRDTEKCLETQIYAACIVVVVVGERVKRTKEQRQVCSCPPALPIIIIRDACQVNTYTFYYVLRSPESRGGSSRFLSYRYGAAEWRRVHRGRLFRAETPIVDSVTTVACARRGLRERAILPGEKR